MTTPMRKRIGVGVAALLFCLGVSPGAWAWHRGHVHFGVFVGAPLWGPVDPFFYYPPYYPYYYPPVSQVVVEQPPVYVQRNDTAAGAPPANYWYYCANPQGYYPYVQNCPQGWMQVVPQAPK